jgi:NADPH:quinone reductase-like Zn-dependent oxidoreductase
MMNAVILREFGNPADVLKVERLAVPEPGSGEVRVRMLASPVNPSDLMMTRGTYTKLPAGVGFEGVGVVEAAGGGILGKLLVGRRVACLNGSAGCWAERCVLPARQAVPLPGGLPVEQGATFFVNPASAYVMTVRVLKVPAGAWLAVTAGGSELGKMVIRLGRRFGWRTLAIVRRSDAAAELTKLGAAAVIATDEAPATSDEGARTPLVERIRNVAGGGLPFAIDCVGGAVGSAVLRSLAPGARMLCFGTLSGEPYSFSPRDLMTPGASLTGFWLGNWMLQQSLLGKIAVIRAISRLIRDGVLTSTIGPTFPLAQVAEAVTAAEQSARQGKVLLRIGE